LLHNNHIYGLELLFFREKSKKIKKLKIHMIPVSLMDQSLGLGTEGDQPIASREKALILKCAAQSKIVFLHG
jgi:hypothetical protein